MQLCQGRAWRRLPLIVGRGHPHRRRDRVRQGGQVHWCDAILVTTPPYALPTDQENAVHALAIDRAADLPIMLYNHPAHGLHGRGVFRPGRKAEERRRHQGKPGDMSRPPPGAEFPHISLSCGWDDRA